MIAKSILIRTSTAWSHVLPLVEHIVDGSGDGAVDGFAEMHDPTELLGGSSGAENMNKQWRGRWHGGAEVEDVSDDEEVEQDL